MTEVEQTKMILLKQMHKYVIDIGDEDLYWYWITEAVPDEPDDDIYEFIATHEDSWLNCCKVFHKIYLASEKKRMMRHPKSKRLRVLFHL